MKNWKTTISGIGTAAATLLTTLAILPYQLGDIATIIPPEYKVIVFKVGAVATVILKVWNSVATKDAAPSDSPGSMLIK